MSTGVPEEPTRSTPPVHADPPSPDGIRALLRGLPSFPAALPDFDPRAAPDDPAALFAQWLGTAIDAEVPAPHAMTLATADERGDPSARVLILKDVVGDGWLFASDADSRKGRDLAVRPRAALTFHWPSMGRQVRVGGAVRPADPADSAADFLARSAGARAQGLAGRQGEVLRHRADLERAVHEARADLDRRPDLVAPGWTRYVLTATHVEFWQADHDRHHTRLEYRRTDSGWSTRLLWP